MDIPVDIVTAGMVLLGSSLGYLGLYRRAHPQPTLQNTLPDFDLEPNMPTNWNRLILQIAESEVSYHVIKKRRDALLAITSRTPEQESELGHYVRQITHDDAIIAQWRQQLINVGMSLTAPAALLIRANMLSLIRERLQDRLNTLDSELARIMALRIVQEIREVDREITEDSRREQLAHWAMIRQDIAEHIRSLDVLDNSTPTW